ncbi:MAG: hypothetical protein IKD77_03810 [Bacilli bacterium]|nr:hypothetical protein [Bacilli bacterium]
MNKIVPFKKDIEFESIHEIKSISLEHTIIKKEGNLVKGKFILDGTYKMTEASINIDNFNYELPFEINIDSKYETEDMTVDINDFYYEIIDNEILSINIEIKLENLNEREVRNVNIEEIKSSEEIKLAEEAKQNLSTTEKSEEKYVTYKIHFVTEKDTIETIIQKYETKREELEKYNNLDEIKIGNKIIIPTNE